MVKSATASLRTTSPAATAAPSPKTSHSRLFVTIVLLPAVNPDQEPLEAFDDVLPSGRLHRGPRPSPHRCDLLGLARELHRRRDEALSVAYRDGHTVDAARDVHAGRGVVIRNHPEAAGHRLQGDVAKRLGLAGEQEHISRGVVRGEVVPRAESGEDEFGLLVPKRRAQRPDRKGTRLNSSHLGMSYA